MSKNNPDTMLGFRKQKYLDGGRLTQLHTQTLEVRRASRPMELGNMQH